MPGALSVAQIERHHSQSGLAPLRSALPRLISSLILGCPISVFRVDFHVEYNGVAVEVRSDR